MRTCRPSSIYLIGIAFTAVVVGTMFWKLENDKKKVRKHFGFFYNDELTFNDDYYELVEESERSTNNRPKKKKDELQIVRDGIAKESLKVLNDDYYEYMQQIPNQQIKDVAQAGCESTLLIMRHCEKNELEDRSADANYNKLKNAEGKGRANSQANNIATMNSSEVPKSGRHCTAQGYVRTQYLATLFGNTTVERWPHPAQLLSLTLHRSGHVNFREYETLRPLANKFGIEIVLSTKKHIRKTFMKSLNSGRLCGALTVVCWKHSEIPSLAASLGCSTADGCPDHYEDDEYDEVWQLKFVLNEANRIFHYAGEREVIQKQLQTPYKPAEINMTNRNETNFSLTHEAPSSQPNEQESCQSQSSPTPPHLKWNVYGSVTYQNFDPHKALEEQT